MEDRRKMSIDPEKLLKALKEILEEAIELKKGAKTEINKAAFTQEILFIQVLIGRIENGTYAYASLPSVDKENHLCYAAMSSIEEKHFYPKPAVVNSSKEDGSSRESRKGMRPHSGKMVNTARTHCVKCQGNMWVKYSEWLEYKKMFPH